VADPGEKDNLLDSIDEAVQEARGHLEGVVKGFPEKDAAPQYDPLPPQPWDKKPKKMWNTKTQRRGEWQVL